MRRFKVGITSPPTIRAVNQGFGQFVNLAEFQACKLGNFLSCQFSGAQHLFRDFRFCLPKSLLKSLLKSLCTALLKAFFNPNVFD